MNKVQAACLAAFACCAALYTSAAFAGGITMVLVRSSLSNDPDSSSSSDLWQYEGGVVQNAAGTASIGHYIASRRVTSSGTSADNTAAETITLFFPSATAGNVPNNITLEGAYSYNTGQFAGSVSAVSVRYRPLVGDDANGTISGSGTTKIIIDFDGTNQVP